MIAVVCTRHVFLPELENNPCNSAGASRGLPAGRRTRGLGGPASGVSCELAAIETPKAKQKQSQKQNKKTKIKVLLHISINFFNVAEPPAEGADRRLTLRNQSLVRYASFT